MTHWLNEEEVVRDIVLLGSSVGGVAATSTILAGLAADLPAIVGVVIHRGAHSSASWAPTFQHRSPLRVVEPADGDSLSPGVVYVAPSDRHLRFVNERASVVRGPKVHRTRPAIDPLFSSAASAYGRRVVAVVLSGGGSDGVKGLRDVAHHGGLCLAQQPSEATDASMPTHAIRHDDVSAMLRLAAIADVLVTLVYGRRVLLTEEAGQPSAQAPH